MPRSCAARPHEMARHPGAGRRGRWSPRRNRGLGDRWIARPSVTHYRAPGGAWGQYTVLFVVMQGVEV